MSEKLEIKIPSVGESITQADIEAWEKQTGDMVEKGDILVLIETDKASLEIPAEQKGQLTILKPAGETVSVGETIGFLKTVGENFEKTAKQREISQNIKAPAQKEQPSPSPPSPKPLSPAVRRLAGEYKLNTDNLQGTGKEGRLTKEDILQALKEEKESPLENGSFPESAAPPISIQISPETGQRRERMTRLRKTIAERLLHSQHTTATLSTFNEADMSKIKEMRQKYQSLFTEKYAVKLGFMGFFVKAVVYALKQYPRINAFIEGEDIVYNNFCHIGIAVSTDSGLVVPVIRKADELSLAGIEKQIKSFSEKAKARKLTPEDLLGGTFTISNGGVFGSLLSTPILNPPQSGILGMHKIEPRPVVKNSGIQIRPMMYLTLSYDHRIVDGRESVGFLIKVKEALEEPARILIDV